MMAVPADRNFAETRTFLTCHGSTPAGRPTYEWFAGGWGQVSARPGSCATS
jgi:hypothetical protein